MKKISMLFCCFMAILLMISCGGSSSDNNSVSNFGKLGKECYPNKTCDSGLICEDESNTCIEDSINPINGSDSSSEQTNDNADTSSEQKDDQIDTMSESVNDSGDTNPNDADLGDSANENPNNLPECSPTSSTLCYDSTSHLTWSKKSTMSMQDSYAIRYCSGSFGGFSDWRLPTISELRTLIQNCSNTQMPGGSCGITHPDHLSYYNDWNDACDGCPYDKNHPGQYSKFGDSEFFWSSSSGDENHAWIVAFSFGAVGMWAGYYDDNGYPIDDSYYVRCVR